MSTTKCPHCGATLFGLVSKCSKCGKAVHKVTGRSKYGSFKVETWSGAIGEAIFAGCFYGVLTTYLRGNLLTLVGFILIGGLLSTVKSGIKKLSALIVFAVFALLLSTLLTTIKLWGTD